MAEEGKKPETDASASDESQKPNTVVTLMGREFDIATPEGRAGYDGAKHVFETTVGKQSEELGKLRKEVEPFRKYNLERPDFDEAKIREKVSKLRAEGEHNEADNLMFEYNRQLQLDIDQRREEDRLWSDYKSSRPDLFKRLPEDMARQYVLSNYRAELAGSEDPHGLLDRILEPKAAKLSPAQEVDTPAAVLGEGSATPPASTEPDSDKSDDASGAWDKMLDEFGVK